MGHGGKPVTPTLFGRIQTRIFLALFLGLPITVFYMLAFGAFSAGPGAEDFFKLLLLLAYVNALGCLFDTLWIFLQSFRWDRDWPLAFQFGSGLVEGLAAFALFALDALPGVDYSDGDALRFALHYGTVFLCSFAFLIGPMRVVAPRWRFRGGRVFF